MHEKHCKSITIQYHVADGVSWVPRLTLLDLQTELMNTLSEQISFVCRGLTVQWNSTAHHLETKAAKKGSWAAVGCPQGAWLWSPVMASRLRCSTPAGLQVSQVSWQHPQSGEAENHSSSNPASWTQHPRWHLSEPRSGVSSAHVKRWYLMFSVNMWPWNLSTALRGKKQIKWKLAATLPYVDIVLGASEGSSY